MICHIQNQEIKTSYIKLKRKIGLTSCASVLYTVEEGTELRGVL